MEFAKLHGTGNDFVVIDARGVERDWSALARRMCDRHFGVGADGLILATGSDVAPVRMRIFNADGSEAEMSGNGLRCLVKFVVDRRFDHGPDAIRLRDRIGSQRQTKSLRALRDTLEQ